MTVLPHDDLRFAAGSLHHPSAVGSAVGKGAGVDFLARTHDVLQFPPAVVEAVLVAAGVAVRNKIKIDAERSS